VDGDPEHVCDRQVLLAVAPRDWLDPERLHCSATPDGSIKMNTAASVNVGSAATYSARHVVAVDMS
jgi:hypothetical protein